MSESEGHRENTFQTTHESGQSNRAEQANSFESTQHDYSEALSEEMDNLQHFPDHPKIKSDRLQTSLFMPEDEVERFHKKMTRDTRATHALFDLNSVNKEKQNERNATRLNLLKQITQDTIYKRPHKPDGGISFTQLKEDYPNFTEVTEELERQMAMLQLSDQAIFTLRPILLVGPPGVGKTSYFKRVASLLGMESHKIDCGSITASWVLSGSSVSWSEGKPGNVYTAMLNGKQSNPFFILDEINRISGDHRFDPFSPLHQLLERDSSKEFVDEAIDIPMDCSQISWFSTANEINNIPDSILSRFVIVNIKEPDMKQMPKVIHSIYTNILHEYQDSWGACFNPVLSEEVIDYLLPMNPRDVSNAFFKAFGYSAKSNAAHYKLHRKPIKLNVEDFAFDLQNKKQNVGFLR